MGVPDPLDLCQPCWELVLSVLKRWRQLHPSVRRDTASHKHLGNKEGHRALGSLTEISTQMPPPRPAFYSLKNKRNRALCVCQ